MTTSATIAHHIACRQDQDRFALFMAPLPELSESSTRDEMVAWLARNDQNGVYFDADLIAEGYAPLTVGDCRDLIADQLAG